MWNKELEVSKKAAVEAGLEILKIYNDDSDWETQYKEDGSPLTRADKASNAVIVKALREAFPSYAVLSEEEKDNKKRLENDLCFVVDPLDGTKEFIKRNGQFTVNIALSNKHRTVMGVIYVPVTGELYYASEGDGAFLRTEDGNERKLAVSGNTDHSALSAVVSGSHGCEEMEELIRKYDIRKILRIGSSLKGCLVAKGDADVYFRHNPTMEWDTAAMQCIVEEAGGIFRQMDDSPMLYNREDSLNSKGFYAINAIENRLR
ncbi:MAG: 3'(2'),5'-bisphosphate nucleotidase CysQ [Lachnospiraceae bacterium]|nr:3'(2'),5'-bisphosphate nucleotidase CysQ [Lachnospiraceae bacterium]